MHIKTRRGELRKLHKNATARMVNAGFSTDEIAITLNLKRNTILLYRSELGLEGRIPRYKRTRRAA